MSAVAANAATDARMNMSALLRALVSRSASTWNWLFITYDPFDGRWRDSRNADLTTDRSPPGLSVGRRNRDPGTQQLLDFPWRTAEFLLNQCFRIAQIMQEALLGWCVHAAARQRRLKFKLLVARAAEWPSQAYRVDPASVRS